MCSVISIIQSLRECFYSPDIDECVESSDNCDDNRATCTNTRGSYNCSCNHGYIGNGFTSQCSELIGGYSHYQEAVGWEKPSVDSCIYTEWCSVYSIVEYEIIGGNNSVHLYYVSPSLYGGCHTAHERCVYITKRGQSRGVYGQWVQECLQLVLWWAWGSSRLWSARILLSCHQ